MGNLASAAQLRSVAELRSKIDDWRGTKRAGEAMPAGLWSAAVELAEVHSVYEVSRGLGVDYGKLKRLTAARAVGCQTDPAVAPAAFEEEEPEFVELAGLFEAKSVAVIEMRRGDGSSIRMELPEAQVDLVELATAFWWGAA